MKLKKQMMMLLNLMLILLYQAWKKLSSQNFNSLKDEVVHLKNVIIENLMFRE